MTNKYRIIDLLNDIDDWAKDCPYEEDIVDATDEIAEIITCVNNRIKQLEKALGLACREIPINCDGRCDKCSIDECCCCSDGCSVKKTKQFFINKAMEENNE